MNRRILDRVVPEHHADLAVIQEEEDLEGYCTGKHDRDEQRFKHRIVIIRKPSRMQGKTTGGDGDHDQVQGIPQRVYR